MRRHEKRSFADRGPEAGEGEGAAISPDSGSSAGRDAVLTSFAPELLNYRGIGSGVVRALKHWPATTWTNDKDAEKVVATIPLIESRV